MHEIHPKTSLTLCFIGLVRRQAILIQCRHLKKHRISLLKLSGNAYKAIFARNLGLAMGNCSDNCLNITCHCVANDSVKSQSTVVRLKPCYSVVPVDNFVFLLEINELLRHEKYEIVFKSKRSRGF